MGIQWEVSHLIVKTLLSRVLISSVILAAVFVLGFLGTQVASNILPVEEAYNAESLIRLHILANSDLPRDQELKLDVRDAILTKTQHLFSDITTKTEAWQRLVDNQDLVCSIAQEVIAKSGKDYPVEVRLGRYDFPEKTYGPLTVPAGDYQAIQVIIGRGQGHNWWCVLFPPLCFMENMGSESVKRELKTDKPGQPSKEQQVAVHWRLKYLDAIYRECGNKLAALARSDWGLRFLSTAQLPAERFLR